MLTTTNSNVYGVLEKDADKFKKIVYCLNERAAPSVFSVMPHPSITIRQAFFFAAAILMVYSFM